MPDPTDLIGVLRRKASALPLIPVTARGVSTWLTKQPAYVRKWLKTTSFQAKAGNFCLVPDKQGALTTVLIGADQLSTFRSLGHLAGLLPAADYRLAFDADVSWDEHAAYLAVLGFALGGYRFDRYKQNKRKAAGPRLLVTSAQCTALRDELAAITLARDLINTPAADMMPADLARAASALAKRQDARYKQVAGKALFKNYPLIHAVGRASMHAPRLIELRWGKAKHPEVVLVGKGVCFDSGGLDLKPASNMRLMKKDMGGAACALGLAALVMSRALPVRLRVLIAAVENTVSSDSFRPGDIVLSRKGLSVEIENTDAEGRLVLADALTLACEARPDLIIDFATLTGAARVALGTDLPALFTNSDEIADGLAKAAMAVEEPLWRLPLYRSYENMLESAVADMSNAPKDGYGGAIVAALFLERFVDAGINWVHYDIMGWNQRTQPAMPAGGEAMAVRASYRFLADHFG